MIEVSHREDDPSDVAMSPQEAIHARLTALRQMMRVTLFQAASYALLGGLLVAAAVGLVEAAAHQGFSGLPPHLASLAVPGTVLVAFVAIQALQQAVRLYAAWKYAAPLVDELTGALDEARPPTVASHPTYA